MMPWYRTSRKKHTNLKCKATLDSITITRPVAQPEYDVRLPMSKSIVNRMLVLDPEHTLQILPPEELLCDDLRVMTNAVKTVIRHKGETDITTIDLNASGTAMRFITALCAVSKGTWKLTGCERLCRRPVGPLVDALRQGGATISYTDKEGFPPLMVTCTEQPRGGRVEVDGTESSQYVSALMLVADRFREGLDIYIKGESSSEPYIEMTRKLIHDWKQGKEMEIEYDWSAAAFWLEMKHLMSLFTDFNPDGIKLSGLRNDSIQGDKVAGKIFSELNEEKDVVELDFRNCPDLVQPTVVSCCMAERAFRFTGVRNLRLKETDRLEALRKELGKMGIRIETDDDSMSYNPAENGKQYLTEPVDTYGDHRMAMAFAACALKFGQVTINKPEVVGKSYPTFWHDLQEAGFGIIHNS